MDRAELGEGEVDRRILEAVRREGGNAVAPLDAVPAQHVREAVRQLVQLPVGDAVRTDHVGSPLGAMASVTPHDLAQQESHGEPL